VGNVSDTEIVKKLLRRKFRSKYPEGVRSWSGESLFSGGKKLVAINGGKRLFGRENLGRGRLSEENH